MVWAEGRRPFKGAPSLATPKRQEPLFIGDARWPNHSSSGIRAQGLKRHGLLSDWNRSGCRTGRRAGRRRSHRVAFEMVKGLIVNYHSIVNTHHRRTRALQGAHGSRQVHDELHHMPCIR